jgi:hypothetical protein
MRGLLAASGRSEYVAWSDRMAFAAETVRSFPLEDDEQLFFDMVVMERTPGFAGRNLAVADADILETEKRPERDVAGLEERTTAPVVELQVLRIDDGPLRVRHRSRPPGRVSCPARPRGIGLGALKD